MQPDTNHINQILSNPSLILDVDMVDLQFWAIEYPQVPLFRMLLAKKANQSRHAEEEQYRMEAAAWVSDRNCLYNYLSKRSDIPDLSNQTAESESPEVIGLEDIQRNVSENIIEESSEINLIDSVTLEGIPPTDIVSEDITQENKLPDTLPNDYEVVSPSVSVPEQIVESIDTLEEVDSNTEEIPPIITSVRSTADELIHTLQNPDPDPAFLEGIPDDEWIEADKQPTVLPPSSITIEPIEPREVFDLTGGLDDAVTKEKLPEIKAPDAGLHSFIEWLDLIDKQKADGEPRIPVKDDWIETPSIDYFPKLDNELPEDVADEQPEAVIHASKAVPEVPEYFAPANMDEQDVVKQAQLSLEFSEDLMTETLAKLYTRQGKKAKAIKIYKALALHNPEKSSYFAALIQQLEES